MQKNKIFIGNVSYGTAIETLVELCLKYGEITDSYKPQGKGFAFITFQTDEQAQAAIEGLNGMEIDKREVVVNIARPKEDRRRNGFSDRDRRGGGFNRNRNHGNGRNFGGNEF